MFFFLATCILLGLNTVTSAIAATSGKLVVMEQFDMGPARVYICTEESDASSQSGAPFKLIRRQLLENPTPFLLNPPEGPTVHYNDKALRQIDLTPAKCTRSTCYPGDFQPPPLDDCKRVVQAQLYWSKGNLLAYPGLYVYVAIGKCATVLQTPRDSPYAVQYNWAQLGATAAKLISKCLLNPGSSIGGICRFESFIGYEFKNVMISVQRFDESELQKPK